MAHGGHTGGARSHSHVHHYGGGYGRGEDMIALEL